MSKACSNCGFTLSDDFIYCPKCAQKVHLHRLSLHEVLHEGVHYFTHADKGIIHLLKDLFTKTGTVAKEYIAGKRKSYFPPLNFFLLVATIYVLVMGLVTPKPSGNVLKDHPELQHIPDVRQKEKVIGIYERKDKAIYFMNKYSNVVAMIAAPLLCFIYWLFYIKARYNYTEHLIACMYMAGLTNLVYVLLLVPLSLLFNLRHSNSLIGILMVFQLVYNSVFYYHFIERKTTVAAIKATAISLIAVLIWMGLSYYAISMYIRSGFWGLLH